MKTARKNIVNAKEQNRNERKKKNANKKRALKIQSVSKKKGIKKTIIRPMKGK